MSISRMSRGGARRPSCLIRDAYGQALGCAYFEDEPGRRAAAHLPTRDEARRIAANSPSCRSCCVSHRPLSTHFRYDINSGRFAALRSVTSWAKERNRSRGRALRARRRLGLTGAR